MIIRCLICKLIGCVIYSTSYGTLYIYMLLLRFMCAWIQSNSNSSSAWSGLGEVQESPMLNNHLRILKVWGRHWSSRIHWAGGARGELNEKKKLVPRPNFFIYSCPTRPRSLENRLEAPYGVVVPHSLAEITHFQFCTYHNPLPGARISSCRSMVNWWSGWWSQPPLQII